MLNLKKNKIATPTISIGLSKAATGVNVCSTIRGSWVYPTLVEAGSDSIKFLLSELVQQ
ncbi:MAG: hypothetical protein Ct9H90mP25_5430 [Gammaproteobacteria bacterium]|nr:MAG: hypothetical protein Ct9H90mP25_5430 [Gammaproteobacteria bacterium]